MKIENSYLKNKKSLKHKESGQVLLFVVVAMSIALAVGVAISSRTLSSLSRTSRTDTSSRVYAAAEGGIETYLNKPYLELQNFADWYTNTTLSTNCPSGTYVGPFEGALEGCSVNYQVAGENITSRAVVTVKTFKTNQTSGSNNFYTFDIKNGDTKEVNLQGYNGTLDICWNDSGTDPDIIPDLLVSHYTSTYLFQKNIISPASGETNSVYYTNGNSLGVSRLSSNSSVAGVYTYCYTGYAPIAGSYGVRIKALFDDAKVGVRPSNLASFPVQGYEIISRGELTQEGATKSVKTIRVYKSLPYLPGVFDNAIYSEGFIVLE